MEGTLNTKLKHWGSGLMSLGQASMSLSLINPLKSQFIMHHNLLKPIIQ